MKRVLLTGATGFIGQQTLAFLLERGYEVHTVSSRKNTTDHHLNSFVLHHCDLKNPIEVSHLLKLVRPSHLLHFAWYTKHGQFWQSPENLDWAAATLHLLREFQIEGGQRVVMAGTCAEYQWPSAADFSETSPCVPATPYGVAKIELAQNVALFCARHGLGTAWGRVFFMYGPGEAHEKLVSSAILAFLKGESLEFSDGRQIRDFMFVRDVARAFVTLLDSSLQGPINIASGEGIELREIIQRAAKLCGRSAPVRFGGRPNAPNDPPRIVADVSRLKNELKFVPEFDLNSGLGETIQYWQDRKD